jgi:hypothetical protein
MDAPDTLTDDQMHKLGAVDLPDTLTDDQMDRAAEQPKALPPTEDERLGIDTPLAKPSGYVWDSKAKEFRKADQIGTERALPPGFTPEKPLIKEDPAMAVFATGAGAGVGKLVGAGVSKFAPIAAKVIEPAVAGATTSYVEHPGWTPTVGDLAAGGIGAALGVPGAAAKFVRGAPERMAERLPSEITGATRTKAAKQVVTSNTAENALDAHPDLKRVLATGNVQEKFNATAKTLDALTRENDKVYDAIQATHQGVPLDPVVARVRKVAEAAHAAGDETLENAATSAAENLGKFADVADKRGPVLTATQLRGVRNNLARRVQAINPTLGATDVQAAADEIKRAINGGIEDIAARTKGVDVAALKARNQQIASLMPIQQTLREQAIAKKLLGPEDHLADFIAHPQHEIAGLVRKGRAVMDMSLATSPRLQQFAEDARFPVTLANPRLSDLPGRVMAAGAASGLRGKRSQNDLEYAARVSQLMESGKSLQEAIDEAEAR